MTLNKLMMRITELFADIRPHEIKAAWISFFFVFTLMAAYYILRPIRDAMSSDWSDSELSALFTTTFICSVLVTVLYGAACSKVQLGRLLPGVYIIFSITFFAFFIFLNTAHTPFIEKCFYVWVSVFGLFQISVFWTFMADIFTQQQAPRLFGFIAAGSSIGALVGPALALFLIGPFGKENLILVSSFLLLTPVFAITTLAKMKRFEAHNTSSSLPHNQILGGNLFSGFYQFVRDPYLLGMGVFLLLFTTVSTFVYFQLKNLMVGMDADTRTQIWSGMDLVVNSCSIIMAFFVTGRLTARLGLTGVLALIPVVMVLGFLLIAIAPMLWIVIIMQCARRAGDYAITKPAREMLFTAVEREQRFKAKSVIDNVVYRGGDTIAAWGFTGLTQGLGLGASMVAGVGAVIAVLWAATGIQLGKHYYRMQYKPEESIK